MRASGGSSQLWDIDQVQADVVASGTLTLDKSTWNKVFFSMLGGSAKSVTATYCQQVSCSTLDANTCVLTNETNAYSAQTGIKALRVT